jgi:hypothetical protein
MLSKQEYEQQAKTETEKALAELQKFLEQNPEALEKVKEENEIRMRRFAKGRNHMDVATKESKRQEKKQTTSEKWGLNVCTVQ